MEQVSKQELEFLISQNVVKQERGQLVDVKITGKSKSKRKVRWVTPEAYEKLKELKGK